MCALVSCVQPSSGPDLDGATGQSPMTVDGGWQFGRIPRRASQVPDRLARRPRLGVRERASRRCQPDGLVDEWSGVPRIALVRESPKHLSEAGSPTGYVSMTAYSSGICVMVEVRDKHHLAATSLSTLAKSDHVVVELEPLYPSAKPIKVKLGVRMHVGTQRQLVQFTVPDEPWRAKAVRTEGRLEHDRYVLEMRLPLSTLVPLRVARTQHWRYRITVHDAPADGRPESRLRGQGVFHAKPAPSIPASVVHRSSVRICRARFSSALWNYEGGWRCAVPYWTGASGWRLANARLPSPPRFQYLRERVAIVNVPGLGVGIAALFDRHDKILSLLDFGVVGSKNPGNAHARDSDAEVFQLPDETWAFAMTHATAVHGGRSTGECLQRDRSRADQIGRGGPCGSAGRIPAEVDVRQHCLAGHRVMRSVVALSGAPTVTPHKAVPDPKPPPRLVEVFRTIIDDCDESRAFAIERSRDKRTIVVRDRVFPLRKPVRFRYEGGWYRVDTVRSDRNEQRID